MQDSRPYHKPNDPHRYKTRRRAHPGWSADHRRSHAASSIWGRWSSRGRSSPHPSCHTESHGNPPPGAALHASTRIDPCRIRGQTPRSLPPCQQCVHCAHPETSEVSHKTNFPSSHNRACCVVEYQDSSISNLSVKLQSFQTQLLLIIICSNIPKNFLKTIPHPGGYIYLF